MCYSNRTKKDHLNLKWKQKCKSNCEHYKNQQKSISLKILPNIIKKKYDYKNQFKYHYHHHQSGQICVIWQNFE